MGNHFISFWFILPIFHFAKISKYITYEYVHSYICMYIHVCVSVHVYKDICSSDFLSYDKGFIYVCIYI